MPGLGVAGVRRRVGAAWSAASPGFGAYFEFCILRVMFLVASLLFFFFERGSMVVLEWTALLGRWPACGLHFHFFFLFLVACGWSEDLGQ